MHFELKRLDPEVSIPTLGSLGAAAFDLQAARFINEHQDMVAITEPLTLLPGETVKIGTGLAIHSHRPDVAAMILPRSGLGSQGLVIGNLVGLIDSDYQGELIVCLWNRHPEQAQVIQRFQRIAQLLFIPLAPVQFKEVSSFSEVSDRGTQGFGSSGL